MTNITASNLCDAAGVKIPNGTAYFTPCKPDGSPLPGFRRGEGGQAAGTSKPVQAVVTNGALSASLASSTDTTPANVAYRLEVRDPGGALLIGPYVLQVSGATFDLDAYTPILVPLPLIQVGPPGPAGPANTLAIGTVSSGGSAAASITGSAPSQTLNLVLPTAAPNSLAIGTVSQGTAAATITGSAPSQTLNLTLPPGPQGLPGEVTGQLLTKYQQMFMQNPSRNWYDSSYDVASSYINHNTGVIAALSGWTVRRRIPANAGGQMICNQATGQTEPNGIVFQDINEQFISGIAAVAANTPFSVPSNAVYVAFGQNNAVSNPATLGVFWGNTLPTTSSKTFAVTSDIASQVDTLRPVIAQYGAPKNLYDPSTEVTSSYVNAPDGTIQVAGTGFESFSASAAISILPGTKFVLNQKLLDTGNTGLAFYKDGVFVSGIKGSAYGTGGYPIGSVFTVPTNANQVRITLQHSNSATYMLWTDTALPPVFVPLAQSAAQASFLYASSLVYAPLAGKKFAVFGDSISQILSDYWQGRIIAKAGMTKVYQNAKAGRTTIQFNQDYSGAGGTFATGGAQTGYVGCTVGNTLTQDLVAAAPDVIILELSTNDGGTTLGTLADAANTTTFYGILETVLSTITTALPSAKLVWVTPYHYNPASFSGTPHTLATWKAQNQAIKEKCQQYSCAVADMLSGGSMNPSNTNLYTGDGVHINNAGADRFFVPILLAELRKLFA